ncbi:unnamed protein product [Somion occarium]|uniref:Uncharacterized protein n=1 Tax=Somion occarium TaxID=3059160 RepID=A0ABP1DUE5_9APHY
MSESQAEHVDTREQNRPEEGEGNHLEEHEEDVTEWREGSDKVIEKRRGPGEDVEVTVIKNAYKGDSGEGGSVTRRRSWQFAEDTLQEIKRKVARACSPEALMRTLEGAGRGQQQKAKADAKDSNQPNQP